MKKLSEQQLKSLIEAMLFVSAVPLKVKDIQKTLAEEITLTKKRILVALQDLEKDYDQRGIELIEVASGYRFQAKNEYSELIALLFKEKAPRYSRALMETLALIAYRQPITRGEIEDIRGVAVSSYIIKTLQERDWIHVVGHKEVPGRPGLFATTNEFLDYFSLKSLAELPELMQVNQLDLNPEKGEAPSTSNNAVETE
ncbi:SMC-Scp complex subunit ScpB [Thalassomonas sp. M1454]|uniref:SMC-Scp complex subunit ScpB n=1 Tax=Thalassomonas sp. M1454 TaxID=2594477 RepID=UPI00117FE5AD|nr:SMC-Scp complex subunit ScpB [Thalassomonas sp. M1454]TRX55730.1 SMC-Scp complex subunit ScpB [Thalassomonas sp. M1454]